MRLLRGMAATLSLLLPAAALPTPSLAQRDCTTALQQVETAQQAMEQAVQSYERVSAGPTSVLASQSQIEAARDEVQRLQDELDRMNATADGQGQRGHESTLELAQAQVRLGEARRRLEVLERPITGPLAAERQAARDAVHRAAAEAERLQASGPPERGDTSEYDLLVAQALARLDQARRRADEVERRAAREQAFLTDHAQQVLLTASRGLLEAVRAQRQCTSVGS